MKALIAFSLLFSSVIEARCNPDVMEFSTSTNYTLSIGGKGVKVNTALTVKNNVPFSINGKMACFSKSNSFSMNSEKKSKKSEEKIIVIKPMKTKFVNVPNAHQKQYIFVENNPDKMLTKFHIMSFVCAGGVPLSIEATSDSVFKIMSEKPRSANVGGTMVIATGEAAAILKKRKEDPSASSETFDFFSKIYMERSNKVTDQEIPCCIDYKVPSIISTTSINSFSGVERAIASSLTTMADNVPNGCSEDFAHTMRDYQLENWKSNESLKNFNIEKKKFSSDLVFEWIDPKPAN